MKSLKNIPQESTSNNKSLNILDSTKKNVNSLNKNFRMISGFVTENVFFISINILEIK